MLVLLQTVHEAQAGRQCREARGGDRRRNPDHDLCVCRHVLQHAGATLLFLRPPGYDADTHEVYTEYNRCYTSRAEGNL